MRITVGHQFVGFLTGGIERHGMVDVIMNRKRHVSVATIHGAGGRVDEMVDPTLSTAFENIHKPFDVALGVGMRVYEGIAHTGLSGEMHDSSYRFIREEVAHALSVSEIQLDEVESLACFQLCEASFL